MSQQEVLAVMDVIPSNPVPLPHCAEEETEAERMGFQLKAQVSKESPLE
jgi:hypothetical protein